MEWGIDSTIGFNAGSEKFANFTSVNRASDIDCFNIPDSEYTNIIYLLSNESPEIPVPG